jgi:hypothetical protein
MSESELVQQLKIAIDDIRHRGLMIEEKSAKYDFETKEILKSGRQMCEKYLIKPFDDSFNI